jgi:uncharacterized protein YjdB
MADFRPVRSGLLRVVTAALVVQTLATCDALTAPKTDAVSITWVGDTTVTAGLTVPLSVDVTVGGNVYSNPRFAVSSSDTTVVRITGADSLKAVRLGSVTVTVQLVNVILTGNAPVLKQTLVVAPQSVKFSRTADTLHSLGETFTPSITALDAKGDSIPGVSYTWKSSDTTIFKVSNRGQITTVANGQGVLRAIVEGDTASLGVTVKQLLVHFAITPPLEVTLNAINADTTLVAAGRDSLGSPIVGPSGTPLWVVQSANVVSINQSGQLTAIANGTAYVYATHGLARDSIQANVIQQATRLLVTAPRGFSIAAVGGADTLSVAAFDRLNNPVTNDQATLVSLDPAIAQVQTATRVVTGLGTGIARIVATLDGVADTVQVTVNNTPAKLVLNVDTTTIGAVGDTIQLTATIYNGAGQVIQGLNPFWYTTDSTVVTVLQNGRVIALKTGGCRVIAVFNSISDTAVVGVTNGATTLTILNRNDTLPSIGDTMTIPVQILNARGQSLPASAATWSSNDPTIATVTSNALLTSVAVGKTVIHAVAGVLRDSAIVVVTNNPTTIVLNSTLDTMTARGQTLQYTAQLTNGAGNPIMGAPITWTSSNTGVASVNANGVVTALTNGTTTITATSGSVHANATVVVRSPGTLIVDNSTLDTSYFGTGKAPYLRIGDGVNAAVPGDTVFVRVGAHPYSEEVVVNKAIILVGDPTAYLANGRDPTKLPLLSHDTGTAGILASSPARVVIRTLAIRHTLDGPAINASTAAIQINQVYINPSGDPFNAGRGILIQSTSSATIDTSGVNAVHGYGVTFRNVNTGRVSTTNVAGVTASTSADSTYGAGIAVIGGTGNLVTSDQVRLAAGPEIFIDSSASVTVTANNIAGEEQLMRVLFSSGAQITGNAFDTRLASGETFTGNSQSDGRSGLELNQASGANVTINTFFDNTASQMDHIRIIGTRSPISLSRNEFQGGRWNVRSETSDWTMSFSHTINSVASVVLTAADTVTLTGDTLTTAYSNCVQFTGTAGYLTVSSGMFVNCAPARTGAPAIAMTSVEGSVSVTGVTFIGDWARAVDVKQGHNVSLRGNTALLSTSTPTYPGSINGGVFDLAADSSTVVGNTIEGLNAFTGVFVDQGQTRVDSNALTENGLGLAVGNVATFEGSGNDIFDNDTAGIVDNTASLVTATNNFWGDSLGPRLSTNPQASGDSIVGSVTFAPFNSLPTYAGGRLTAMRGVWGYGQTATAGTTLPEPFDVRVVDGNGRPVSNVQVTFQVTTGTGTLNGSGSTAMVTTGHDGLARATLTLAASPGTNAVTASVPGLGSIVFTATGQ